MKTQFLHIEKEKEQKFDLFQNEAIYVYRWEYCAVSCEVKRLQLALKYFPHLKFMYIYSCIQVLHLILITYDISALEYADKICIYYLLVEIDWSWIYYAVFTATYIAVFLFWQVFFSLSFNITK